MSITMKVYPCSKRGCGAVNPDWMAFETGWPNRIRYWRLGHIPWYTRLAMWLRDDDR